MEPAMEDGMQDEAEEGQVIHGQDEDEQPNFEDDRHQDEGDEDDQHI